MADGFTQADQANRLANLIRFGLIAEVDLTATPARARVEIEDGWVSDWLPVFQLSAGRVMSWSAPVQGEQVVILSPSGELAAGAALRGLNFDGRPAPSAEELLTILASWEDGASDTYDEATGEREIVVPAAGRLAVKAGSASGVFSQDEIVLKVGSAELKITSGAITLKADTVNLGGEGGKAVARQDDPVVNNKVVASSTKVKAA